MLKNIDDGNDNVGSISQHNPNIPNFKQPVFNTDGPRYPHTDPSIPNGVYPSDIPGKKLVFENGCGYLANDTGYAPSQAYIARTCAGAYAGFDMPMYPYEPPKSLVENVMTTQSTLSEYNTGPLYRTYPSECSGGMSIFRDTKLSNPLKMYEFSNYGLGLEHPDIMMYFMSTPTSHSYEVMYPNNLVLPIRINASIQKELGPYAFKDSKNINTCTGVFIVQHFLLATLPRHLGEIEVSKYINYYFNSGIVMSNARDIVAEICSTYGQRDGSMLQPYVRIVTFIPESEFLESAAVFVRHAGVVVGRNLKERSVHPYSVQGSMIAEKTTNRAKNYIDISVVDNTNPNAAYFMKIGKRVMELDVERNLEKVEGATVSIHRSDEKVSSTNSSLSSMGSELGIYKTKEEARYDADTATIKSQLIEERRIDAQLMHSGNVLEKTKLEQDSLSWKAKIDEERFNNEITKLKQENRNIHANIDLEELKLKVETNKYLHAVVKNLMELKAIDARYELELAKAEYDKAKLTRTSALDAIAFCSKILNLVGTFL